MEAIEKIVRFDENENTILKLGKHFSMKDAKIVVLIKEDEISENQWLSLAMKGGSFDFLNDPAEDIYTMEDGVPYKTTDC
ncbi:MAG TPA: hypothetical protein VIJ95_12655 [Hanamia sp.]